MSTSDPEQPKRRRRKKPQDASAPEAAAPEASAAATSAEAEKEEPKEEPKPKRARARKPAAKKEPTAEKAAQAETEPETETDAEPEVEADAEPEVAQEPAKPSAPAPARRRSAREPGAAPPVVRAQAKYVRCSPRKARLVCDHLRGKTVEEARAILAHTPRAVARDWSKVLESAVANAEHNHELVGEDLYVKAVHADDGPTIKRFRPRAMGRATRIRKRTSHLTVLLTPKE